MKKMKKHPLADFISLHDGRKIFLKKSSIGKITGCNPTLGMEIEVRK